MNDSQSLLQTDRYWQILRRHWTPCLRTFLGVTVLGILMTTFKPPTYQAEAKLRFKKSNAVASLSDLTRDLGTFSALVEKSNPINTEAQVIQSEPVVQETVRELDMRSQGRLTSGQLMPTKEFIQKLRVAEILGTDVLKITYQGEDPVRVQEVVNTLIANYLENNIDVSQQEAVEARQFLEEQIPKAEAELQALDAKIKNFKSANSVVSADAQAVALVETLGQLEQQITELRGQLALANSQSEYIQGQLNMNTSQALQSAALSESPAITQMLTSLAETASQLNAAKSRFTPNHPSVIELEETLSTQQEALNREANKISQAQPNFEDNPGFGTVQQQMTGELVRLESSRIGLNQQIDNLVKLQQDLQLQAAKLPELEQQLTQLLRESAVSQETYGLLQRQLSLIELAANQNIGNVRIIEEAIKPIEPISSRLVGYLSSVILGTVAAAGLAYILEAKDRSLKTVDNAKQLFGYNGLGVLPSFNGQGPALTGDADQDTPPLIVRDYPSSALSESYRRLQSNLRYLSGDRKNQTIVVTSSVTGEGKSTVAANLACAMAQVGNKVLLVDANLRNPQQQSIWGTYNNSGLSNLLADNLDHRLSTETVMKNLSVISSGGLPASPGTLIDSYKMKDLIYYWSRIYDYIVLDTPALDKAADASVLGKMADGILLIVKPEQVSHSQAKFTKETLELSGQNVLGIVFNDVNPRLDASIPQYHPLEEESQNGKDQNVLPGDVGRVATSNGNSTFTKSEGELWDVFSSTNTSKSKGSALTTLDTEVDTKTIQGNSVKQLEETITYLQNDLEDLTKLVKEQEDELFLKRQAVRQLQRKVNAANTPERFTLEKELAQEQEAKQLLDETLVGQRRNLTRKRKVLRKYQEALQTKRS